MRQKFRVEVEAGEKIELWQTQQVPITMQASPPSGQMKDSASQFPCCWADQFDWFSFMGCEWKLNELNTSE